MACEDANIHIQMSTDAMFVNRVQMFEKTLAVIEAITVKLQKNGATLSDCRYTLDGLIEAVDEEKDACSSVLYVCRIESNYIASIADIAEYPVFEQGIVKIQNGATKPINSNKRSCEVPTSIEIRR